MRRNKQDELQWWLFYVPGDEEYWGDPNYIDCVSAEYSYWTCNAQSKNGDNALLYARRPVSALVAALAVTSDAIQDPKQQFSTTDCSCCDVKCLSIFKTPLTFREMREDRELREAWGLVRSQFQSPGGRAPRIDDKVISMLAGRIPELRRILRS